MGSVNTNQPPHVLIVGAGVGGLFLAQCLRKQRVSFEIFDQDASISASGPGLPVSLPNPDDLQDLLPDDLLPIQSTCHLLPLPLSSQSMLYVGAKTVGVEDSERTPCTRASRLRLRELLSEQVPVRWGKKAVAVIEDANRALVHFEDGSVATGDVVVGADGIPSTIREHVMGRPNLGTNGFLQPVPEAVVRGEVTLSGEAMERQLELGHSAYVAVGSEGMRLSVGLESVADDGDSANFYWTLHVPDTSTGREDHWLKRADKPRLFRYCFEQVQELETRFHEIIKRTGVMGIQGALTCWSARVPSPPPSIGRSIVLGEAAYPVASIPGEETVVTIKEAARVAGLLAHCNSNNLVGMSKQLSEWQYDTIQARVEAARLSRRSVAAMAEEGGDRPMVWGFPPGPIKQKPVGPSLLFRLNLGP